MSRKHRHTLHPKETFMRLPQVRALTGLSRSTIYRLVAAESFPKGRRISERVTVWLESEVRTWMEWQTRT